MIKVQVANSKYDNHLLFQVWDRKFRSGYHRDLKKVFDNTTIDSPDNDLHPTLLVVEVENYDHFKSLYPEYCI